MSAMRIFCVAIVALSLASCTKQGYRDPICGLVQILNWGTFGAFEGFEKEVCSPEPTKTTSQATRNRPQVRFQIPPQAPGRAESNHT